jgi:hypothetical protein
MNANGSPQDLSVKYLAVEVAQVDAKVQFVLNSLINAGRDQTDRFRGLYTSEKDIRNIARLSNPQGTDDSNELLKQALQKGLEESRAIEQAAENQGERLRLLHLRKFFGLTDFEYYAFLVCLLPALDLRYERIYGFLQDDVTRKQASVDLILTLLDTYTPEISRLKQLGFFGANSTLVKYRLLRPINGSHERQEPRLNQLFEVSPAVILWLMGDYFPEETWLNFLSWEGIQNELSGNSFAESFNLDWKKVAETLPLLAFDGPDEDRQELAAKKVAFYFDVPLLKANLSEACGEGPFDLSVLRLLIRDACLLDAALYIQGWELVLNSDGFIPAEILAEMANFSGFFILGSQVPWRVSRRGGERPIFQIPFEQPSGTERASLWEEALGPEVPIDKETLRNLSSQFNLTSGQIENAVFSVRNKAGQTGKPFGAEDLFYAARQQSSHHLGQLAQKIEPRYTWTDIVLPSNEIDTLRDMVCMMRYRPIVLEEWGLARKLTANQGLSTLFTGEPGTGKTLAAQVIAAELQLDLYRIDLSNVVSKYIGETEKNLEKIFEEAESSNAILFFDEADAIFGRRSEVKDAHDRYANIEVGYLLQRMETHDGITILATNLSANMDEAFTRRLNFIVHFPFPDENQRLAIWKVLLPSTLPVEENINWQFLARAYPLAGGNIRNILVSSAFLAAQNRQKVNMKYLLQATRREMQKMGRFIKEEDYLYANNAS